MSSNPMHVKDGVLKGIVAANSLKHTIAGEGVDHVERFEVINPSTGSAFATCPGADRRIVDAAVEAARAAQSAWEALGFSARGEMLRRLADAMRADSDTLSALITLEQGKTFVDARVEVARAADMFEGFSRQQVESQLIRDTDAERIEEHFHASGVAVVISPWNMPISLFAMRVGPMLQTGNTVVAKPSPSTPLASLRVGELGRAILPPGVLNVVAGQDPLGQWLTEHAGVDRISFTGSVRTGKRVMETCASGLKRVGLELGGNDPAIVLDDVDVVETARQVLARALRNNGQICMAIKRIYVPRIHHEAFLAACGVALSEYEVGDGFKDGVRLGPIQNKMQYDSVVGLLEETLAIPGVRAVHGKAADEASGYFVAPTVVTDVPDSSRIVQDEQFGPVVPVLIYDDLDDAIDRANATRFGLGASVWSSDTSKAAQVAQRLHAGTVWVNDHLTIDVDTPFGGWKDSGVGRGNGLIGLQSCMESNVVRIRKIAL